MRYIGRFLIFVVFVVSIKTTHAQEWMPDPNLRGIIRTELGLAEGKPLTQATMLRLVSLADDSRGIVNLTGLEHATNLTWLYLGGNRISDLTPLSGLTNLTYLNVGDCQVSNIRPLRDLTNLETLILHFNQIVDITPLGNLTNLRELWLTNNLIEDIQPLANLTRLRHLRISHNFIRDMSPLGSLSLEYLESDEFCDLPRLSITERMQDRDFPSVFNAWYDILNRPMLSGEDRLTHHDLIWSPKFWLRLRETTQNFHFMGNLTDAQKERDALLELNPNMLFFTDISMRDAFLYEHDEDWPYWIRDKAGNRVLGAPDYPGYLTDFTHSGMQDIIVAQAVAASRCGLYDGIFLDYWSEGWYVLEGYRTYESEQQARDTIIQRIRAGVGDDFLIIVNPNRDKPTRAAPYINGLFIESLRDNDNGYTREGLIEIESTLLWAEENLRSPQINCLEGWGVKREAPDSPTNLRLMRVFTTMSLTHSDGYVLYITGIRFPDHKHNWNVFEITHKAVHDEGEIHNHHHDHYWYDFWDAELGQPVGEKAQLYQNRQGVFIREFTNGWAVYNRSGKARNIKFSEKVSGVASGRQEKFWHELPDLDGEIYLKQVDNSADITPQRGIKSGDVNADGAINVLDLVVVANAFGEAEPDITGDGTVNILDLIRVSKSIQDGN